ncbi:hypothetical protein HEP_00143300, partial [Hepatocystis sp. ex Piliocolobus tephrosceles]
MVKDILLSLAHNAKMQMKIEMEELCSNITFLEHEINLSKDRKFFDFVNIESYEKGKKEEKDYVKLQEFLLKYIKFLLDNKKSSMISLSDETKGDVNALDLIPKIKKPQKCAHILKTMYKNRDKVNEVLKLVQMINIKNFNDCKSHKLFVDLIKQIKEIENIKQTDDKISSKLIKSNNNNKFKIKKLRHRKKKKDEKKKFLNYLRSSTDNMTTPETDDSSTAPSSTYSYTSSTVTYKKNKENYISLENVDILSKKKDPSNSKNSSNANEMQKAFKDKKMDEGISLIGMENNTSYSDNNFNKKYNKTNSYSSLKSSCIIEQGKRPNCSLLNSNIKMNPMNKRNQLTSEIGKLSKAKNMLNLSFLKYKEQNNFKRLKILKNGEIKNKKISFISGNSEKTNSDKISPNVNIIEKMSNKISNINSQIPFKYIPVIANRSKINNYTEKVGNRNRNNNNTNSNRSNNNNNKKVKKERNNRSSSVSSDSFFSSCSSSDSSKSSTENVCNEIIGEKKYIFNINKNGKGYFIINKKGTKSARKNIYDIEIIYDDNDEDSINTTTTNTNTTNSTTTNNNSSEEEEKKKKKKKIFHFSFLKNGVKVFNVNKLYMDNNNAFKSLYFGSSTNSDSNSGSTNTINSYSMVTSDVKGLDTGGLLKTAKDGNNTNKKKKNNNAKVKMLGKNLTQLKKENNKRKEELLQIIDDIENNN